MSIKQKGALKLATSLIHPSSKHAHHSNLLLPPDAEIHLRQLQYPPDSGRFIFMSNLPKQKFPTTRTQVSFTSLSTILHPGIVGHTHIHQLSLFHSQLHFSHLLLDITQTH